ncbi:MAG: hypothetical protein WA902_15715 [Thermosynechococcaceae cyanobacterium]
MNPFSQWTLFLGSGFLFNLSWVVFSIKGISVLGLGFAIASILLTVIAIVSTSPLSRLQSIPNHCPHHQPQ